MADSILNKNMRIKKSKSFVDFGFTKLDIDSRTKIG